MENETLTNPPIVEYGEIFIPHLSHPYTPYKVGQEIRAICYPGYGSFKVTSVVKRSNGKLVWNPPIIRCGLVHTPKIENGRILSEGAAPFYEGDKATIKCDSGYVSSITEIKVIKKEGLLEWDRPDVSCEPMTLTTPPIAVNGRIVFAPGITAPYPIGTEATLQCDPGHDSSTQTSTLQLYLGKLEWWPSKLICLRYQCPDPPVPPIDGYRIGDERTIHSTVVYQCPSGYELIGEWNGSPRPVRNPLYTICTSRGEWDPELPQHFQCQPFHCPALEFIPHGILEYYRNEGGKATYECFDPSLPIITRACQADGTWSGQTPTCPPVSVPSFNFLWILLVFVCVILIMIVRVSLSKLR